MAALLALPLSTAHFINRLLRWPGLWMMTSLAYGAAPQRLSGLPQVQQHTIRYSHGRHFFCSLRFFLFFLLPLSRVSSRPTPHYRIFLLFRSSFILFCGAAMAFRSLQVGCSRGEWTAAALLSPSSCRPVEARGDVGEKRHTVRSSQ